MFIEHHLNIRRVRRILESYAILGLRLGFAQLSRILPNLLLFKCRYVNTEKSGVLLNQNMGCKLARAKDKQILDARDFILFHY